MKNTTKVLVLALMALGLSNSSFAQTADVAHPVTSFSIIYFTVVPFAALVFVVELIKMTKAIRTFAR